MAALFGGFFGRNVPTKSAEECTGDLKRHLAVLDNRIREIGKQLKIAERDKEQAKVGGDRDGFRRAGIQIKTLTDDRSKQEQTRAGMARQMRSLEDTYLDAAAYKTLLESQKIIAETKRKAQKDAGVNPDDLVQDILEGDDGEFSVSGAFAAHGARQDEGMVDDLDAEFDAAQDAQQAAEFMNYPRPGAAPLPPVELEPPLRQTRQKMASSGEVVGAVTAPRYAAPLLPELEAARPRIPPARGRGGRRVVIVRGRGGRAPVTLSREEAELRLLENAP